MFNSEQSCLTKLKSESLESSKDTTFLVAEEYEHRQNPGGPYIHRPNPLPRTRPILPSADAITKSHLRREASPELDVSLQIPHRIRVGALCSRSLHTNHLLHHTIAPSVTIFRPSLFLPITEMGDFDDFGELYADLEYQVIAGVEAAELEGGEKSEPEGTGAGFEDGILLSRSCSDSEDDLQIVLNEEDYPDKLPPQLIAEGRDCEDDEGDDDLVIVAGPDRPGKEPLRVEQGPPIDGLPLGSGDRGIMTKRAHRYWSRQYSTGSAVRARNFALVRGHWGHVMAPDSLSNTSYSFGFPMTFSNACDYYLPRNRSIFDIDMESFECKPWRFIGVDITDYFNFGLDEEGWKIYCKELVHFQQNKLTTLETSSLNKPGQVAAEVHDDGLATISDHLDKERKGIQMPKGRAIQVESGYYERIPSVDIRRTRNRSSEVVIQITTGLAVEDASDLIIDRANQVDESGTKGDMLPSSKNEPCKSSFSVDTFTQKCERSVDPSDCHQLDRMECGKSSPSRDVSSIKPDTIFADHHSNSTKACDHNDSFEASIDGVFVEKFSIPECKNLDSDSWLQESVFSDCYPSSETGSDTSKTDHTTCGDDSPDSQVQNFRRQTISPKVGRWDAGSDEDGVTAPYCRGREDGEHNTNEIGIIVRNLETELHERDHSTEDDKILLKNIINNYDRKEANSTIVEYSKDVNDEDRTCIHHKKLGSTTKDVKTRQNDGRIIRMAQHNRRTRNFVNKDYIQASSENVSHNDGRNMRFWHRSRAYEHDLRMVASHDSVAAKYRQRERSFDEHRERFFDEYFGMRVPYLYEKSKPFLDEYERLPSSVGKVRSQELDNYYSTPVFGLERSGRYVGDCEDSRIHERGLHPRIYSDETDADERGRHDDVPHRNQVPRLFYKRHMSHSGYSDAGETLFNLSKHCTVSSKECHHFSSKIGFKFDGDHFRTEPRGICLNDSAYSERKNNLALPRLVTKGEVSRHQDSINLRSHKRSTIYSILQHENDRVDKKSFINQKIQNQNIYANHLQDSSQSKLNGGTCKDSDSGFPSDFPSYKFVKDRHEQAYKGCVEAVRKHLDGWEGKYKRRRTKNGGQVRTDGAAYKDSRESMDHEQLSDCSVTLMDNNFCTGYKEGWRQCKLGYINNIMNISSNRYTISQDKIEELEEGELVEEYDDHETTVIKCTSDERIPALTANSVIPSNKLSKHKKDLAESVQINLVGGYDRNYLLATLAKMEKRRERFRIPISPKKEPANCSNMQPHTANQDEVKQQRPARKRCWGSR